MDNEPKRSASEGYLASVALILVLAAAPVLFTLLRMANQGWVETVAIVVLGVAGLFACFPGFARRDRLAIAVIAGPAVVVGAADALLAIAGRTFSVLSLAWLLWILAWCVAGGWLWPRFCRLVLRREPFAEWDLNDRWRAYRRLLAAKSDFDELWDAVEAMRRGSTKRMTPLIDTWFVALDLRPLEDADDRYARLWDRQRELLTAFGSRQTADQPWPNPDRPTEGTQLELAFPELEALVAAATPDERRRIAATAARLALGDAGILDSRWDEVLSRAATGEIDPAAWGELEHAYDAERATRDRRLPEEGDPERDVIIAARRRRRDRARGRRRWQPHGRRPGP